MLSNTSQATTGLAATSSVLLPNSDSSYSERQRIIGSQGLLEKAITVESTYNVKLKKTVYSTLGDDSDYGGFLTRIVHRLERDIIIPPQAY